MCRKYLVSIVVIITVISRANVSAEDELLDEKKAESGKLDEILEKLISTLDISQGEGNSELHNALEIVKKTVHTEYDGIVEKLKAVQEKGLAKLKQIKAKAEATGIKIEDFSGIEGQLEKQLGGLLKCFEGPIAEVVKLVDNTFDKFLKPVEEIKISSIPILLKSLGKIVPEALSNVKTIPEVLNAVKELEECGLDIVTHTTEDMDKKLADIEKSVDSKIE